LKAGLFNELGLNSNYNMKRESINSNESQLNDDMLHPLIDDMLAMRREALEKVNEMFGTNITVDFNSAWKDNEIENEAAIESMEAAAEGAEDMTNETDNIEAASDEKETLIDESENEEIKEEVTGDEAEPIEETAEVSEEVTTTQAIEELTDAVIDLTDVLEGDQAPDEEDEKEGDA
jgi:hypothetical protein